METDEQFVERVAASKSGGSDRVLVLHDEADIDRLLALALRGAKVQWRHLKDAPDSEEPVLLLLRSKAVVIAPAAAAMATVKERADIYKRTGEWPNFTGYEPSRWLPFSALGEPESCASSDTGPLWCQDDIGSDDENGTAVNWCKYIKASVAEAENARLTARIRELEEALGFYANPANRQDGRFEHQVDPDNGHNVLVSIPSSYIKDGGQRASAALRAEVERLKDANAQLQEIVNGDTEEEERIRAEVERLRAALRPFAALVTVDGESADEWQTKFPRFHKIVSDARAALGEKQ